MATAIAPASQKKGAPRQVVFSFDEGAPATRTAPIRGGKGAHLAEMTALGLPVPPGFTITTTVSRAFSQHNRLPKRMDGQFNRAMKRLERQTGKEFGNPENPLLVSVRSGAQASMPGMMDTVLNVGLNPSTVKGLALLQGEQFALDAYCRFLVQFGTTVLDVPMSKLDYVIRTTREGSDKDSIENLSRTCERLRFAIELMTEQAIPDDPSEQLERSLNAVMRSWTSERATTYRKANNLPDWWGTAVNVQAMVFGNRSETSGAGVVFSHDINTGLPGLYGEFLPNAQGEDVVAGTHKPLPISDMAEWSNAAYHDLGQLVGELSEHFGDIVDVEFTVEDSQLYLLQVRRAKRTSLAAMTFAVHQVWAGRQTREEAVERTLEYDAPLLAKFSQDEVSDAAVIARGLSASPGAAIGQVVFSSEAAQELSAKNVDVILVANDTSPDDLLGMLCAKALVTGNGGATCHAAIVAREQGLPAVVGIGESLLLHLTEGQIISVDGENGVVYDGALTTTQPVLPKEVSVFARWKKRFAVKPHIDFTWKNTRQCINQWMTDFYLTDLMAATCRGSALEEEAMELRSEIHQRAAAMLACYLTLAVAGELRHTYDCLIHEDRAKVERTLSKNYKIDNVDRPAAQAAIAQHLTGHSPAEQLRFFQFAQEVFMLEWVDDYGGEAWARIAQAGVRYLDGSWSPTVFVDHVFDLEHNSGSVFDKHSMVSRLTSVSIIQAQLNLKKQITADVSELRYQLGAYFTPSRKVETFFVKGVKTGLWPDYF